MLLRCVVLAVLAACSFTPPSSEPNLAEDGGVEVDAREPITRGDLVCDPDAVCTEAGPSCACRDGFTGDGMVCTDIDECTTDNGGCAGLCVNQPGTRVCAAPATCAELKQLVPATEDGRANLYVGADATKPWQAYCHDVAGTPREFLTVAAASQYTAGGGSPGTDVRTVYTRIRILLAPTRIDLVDRTFATSTGMINHSGDNMMVTSMPVATAMDCRGNNQNTGKASLDLRGTPFAVSAQSFAEGGSMPDHTIDLTDGNRLLSTTGGGNCGWYGPVGLPANPFNDRAQGVTLPLAYDD